LYIWNGFQILKMDAALVKPILAEVCAVVDNPLQPVAGV
jgi:hypothetical protein